MKNSFLIWCWFLLVALPSTAVTPDNTLRTTSLAFIENKGQIIDQNSNPNPAVLFILSTTGMNAQLRRGGFSYDLYPLSCHQQTT